MSEMKSLTLNDKTYDCFVDSVARSAVVVNSASGESIVVSDSSDQPLVGLNLYGKSTQAGTPTPDVPVDIESIGDDGDVVVTIDNDTLALMLGNGLRGIPVTDKTLATYTDANGQMWCADEIDFERGVYVQRIYAKVFTGTEAISRVENATGNYYQLTDHKVALSQGSGVLSYAICSHLVEKTPNALWANTGNGFSLSSNVGSYQLRLRFEAISTESKLKSQLAEWYASETPLIIVCRLATPIETPLTGEEIAAFKALHTDKPNTTVLNDSGAYMTLKYIADAKSYIDNRTSGIIQATVE